MRASGNFISGVPSATDGPQQWKPHAGVRWRPGRRAARVARTMAHHESIRKSICTSRRCPRMSVDIRGHQNRASACFYRVFWPDSGRLRTPVYCMLAPEVGLRINVQAVVVKGVFHKSENGSTHFSTQFLLQNRGSTPFQEDFCCFRYPASRQQVHARSSTSVERPARMSREATSRGLRRPEWPMLSNGA